jgi:chaperonin cofactor prefoldin
LFQSRTELEQRKERLNVRLLTLERLHSFRRGFAKAL